MNSVFYTLLLVYLGGALWMVIRWCGALLAGRASSRPPADSLRSLLACMRSCEESDVALRGLVPGEDPEDYAELVSEAMVHAWSSRGKRQKKRAYTRE